jgi:hypothetical protein
MYKIRSPLDGIRSPFPRWQGFSPASLFAAGEAGFWGEVNPSTLWQDVARTSPVTAAGQSVASWQLNTASGPIYATQSTAGNRPIYQTDGTYQWLEFDGPTSNRWLQTPAINFSATDEVTVIAGLRKLSDAAQGIVVELGAPALGFFNVQAPSGAGANNFGSNARGSITSGAAYSQIAPSTQVYTLTNKISTDSLIVRGNGVQLATSASDQGTGNYANDIIFIGRRNGTSAPFNGRLHSLIVRGALTSGVTLTNAEAWSNVRTGAF